MPAIFSSSMPRISFVDQLGGLPLSFVWCRPHRVSDTAADGDRETASPPAPWLRLFGRASLNEDPARPAHGVSAGSEDVGGRARGASTRGAPRLLPSIDAPRFPRRIETDRLILELPKSEDFPFVLGMAKEPSTFLYSDRGKMSPEEAWNLLLRHVGHWLVAGYGAFTVRERDSGRFVGLVGGSAFHRGLGPEFDEHPELTWSIVEEFRGKGYATEAASAVLDAFDAQPSVGTTVCLIHIDNQASLRVAAKLGFRFFRRCDYRGYPAGLFCR